MRRPWADERHRRRVSDRPSQACPKTRAIGGAGALVFACAMALSGCAGVGPEKNDEPKPEPRHEQSGDMIVVDENASIDSQARASFNAAMDLLSAEKYKEAVPLLETAIERAPRAIAPRVNLGIAYGKLDELEKAEEVLKQALAINPTHPVANNEYAMLLRRTGRFSEAKQRYETVLAAYPDFQPARKNLGILCDLYMNEPGCALESYAAYMQAVPGDEQVKLWIVDLKRRVGE